MASQKIADKIDNKKSQLIDELTKSLGIVSTACKKVGCCRQTFYDYYATDEDFKKQVDDIENITLDFVESKLLSLINENNPTAILFYLKTKGKARGYIERQEIDHTNKGDKFESQIITTLTPEQLKESLKK